ncbi:hypothetical protein ABT160_09955 [Streptomyces sp. NPDC001941]|uniref:hypothetical protein n=1 Tax=Streptomyces sp. NPDC001941 TaxID=3154659 RepID=UPI00331B9C93
MSVGRAVTGGTGLVLLGFGAWLMAGLPAPWDALVWLAGAVAVHDGLVAPLVLAAGLLVAAVPARGVVRGSLVAAGCLTVVALPVLLRPGTPANPSVLPLDYLRNWLLLLAVVAGAGAGLACVLWARQRRAGRRS